MIRASFALAAGCVLYSMGCQASPDADPAALLSPPIAATVLPAQGYAPPDGGTAAATDLRCTADLTLPQKTDYSVPGPYAVGKLDITFEDTSRPIAATDRHAAAPSRTLVTTIYYPAGQTRSLLSRGSDPVAAGGPFPLIMYSHGYSSTRGEATQVGERAASHGYFVVSPDFPLSNLLANNGSPDGSDAHNQAGDVTFLIDQMIAFSRDPDHLFAQAIDDSRIGATGVSMGGFTTLLATFHPTLHDPRIKVSVPMAPLSALFTEGFYHTREVPMLLIHGDVDAFLAYEHSRQAFAWAAPNARLMTLKKGSHAAFAMQLDDATTELMNSLLAPPGYHPTNPDAFGCGAVAETLANGPSVGTGLGGEENFVDQEIAARMAPCTGDEYKLPAMNATEQVNLAATAVVAMFDAHLGATADQRAEGCRYLLQELPKSPSVSIE
jgi:predicted dienelactone hydrolase